MEQVEQFFAGERDYALIKGGTGPLWYTTYLRLMVNRELSSWPCLDILCIISNNFKGKRHFHSTSNIYSSLLNNIGNYPLPLPFRQGTPQFRTPSPVPPKPLLQTLF